MIGTLANTGAIIAGSVIGMMIHSRLSEKMTTIIFQAIGLFTCLIGISMGLRSENMVIVVVSLVIGSIIGQAIGIDNYLHKFSDYIQSEFKRKKGAGGNKGSRKDTQFTEGFVTASMLFCVGSMSILGAIEDGMGETPNLLFTKSLMDGISSVALAASFGISILFSSIPVLIYQGGLTLFATFIMRYMSEQMTTDMTTVGGILLIGLGLSILKIKDIQVMNMLPSLLIVVLLSYLF